MQGRHAGVPVAAAVLGALAGGPALAAGPVLADVTVSPASAAQGSGQNLTFHVTNTGSRPVGTIRLRLPDDTPVAEVYPLSMDDWAPLIDMRTLRAPLVTLHGETPVTETATAITWLAMPGRALAPGRSADLSIALGPLPSVSSMRFAFATTYTDGRPGPALPPVSLTLTPPASDVPAPGGHGGHGSGAAAEEEAAFERAATETARGPSAWSVTGWAVAVLATAVASVLGLRGRRRAAPNADPPGAGRRRAAPDPDPPGAGRRRAAPGPDQPGDSAAAPAGPSVAGHWSYRG